METKKLAILGASYLQLSLILRAKEMGYETHVFAWERGSISMNYSDYFYPISIMEKDLILEKCREIKIHGVTSVASDLAMETANYIAFHLNLVGNSLYSTEISRDKFKMRQAFKHAKLPCPRFLSSKENLRLVSSSLSYPLIVKPTNRSGSIGVTEVYSETELYKAINRAEFESFTNEAIIEEFIQGEEISVECISWKGKHTILATTDKETSGTPYFVEIGHHQPSKYEDKLKDKINKIVFRALDVLQIENGASHTELIITKDNGIFIVEIGARMGGDKIGSELVRLSTGYDFVQGVIEVALDNEPIVNQTLNMNSGIHYITPQAGVITSIKINKKISEFIMKVESILDVGDSIEYPIKESNHRAGYILYQAPQRLLKQDLEKALQYVQITQ